MGVALAVTAGTAYPIIMAQGKASFAYGITVLDLTVAIFAVFLVVPLSLIVIDSYILIDFAMVVGSFTGAFRAGVTRRLVTVEARHLALFLTVGTDIFLFFAILLFLLDGIDQLQLFLPLLLIPRQVQFSHQDFVQQSGQRVIVRNHFGPVTFLAVKLVSPEAAKAFQFGGILVPIGRGLEVKLGSILTVAELDGKGFS